MKWSTVHRSEFAPKRRQQTNGAATKPGLLRSKSRGEELPVAAKHQGRFVVPNAAARGSSRPSRSSASVAKSTANSPSALLDLRPITPTFAFRHVIGSRRQVAISSINSCVVSCILSFITGRSEPTLQGSRLQTSNVGSLCVRGRNWNSSKSRSRPQNQNCEPRHKFGIADAASSRPGSNAIRRASSGSHC